MPALIAGPLILTALCRRRNSFAWRETASPLLLLSVPTAAYGWSFDQLVLLLPYLEVVAWLGERHTSNRIASLAVGAGLLSTSAMILLINHRFSDDLYLLWGPLVWGAFYAIARWRVEMPMNEIASEARGQEWA
jgi:hypothetical protein